MKKNFLLLVVSVMIGMTAFGQQVAPNCNMKGTIATNQSIKSKLLPITKSKFYQTNNTRATQSRWYGYYEAIDSLDGRLGVLNSNIIFPDSTINALYSDASGNISPSAVWIHNVADVIDPKSTIFNDPGIYPDHMQILSNNSYTLDSIGIWCAYVRNTGANIVDTMQIDIISNNTASDMGTAYFTGGALPTNLGVDTVFFKDLGYDYNTNRLSGSNRVTMKIPLDETFYADSVLDGIFYVTMPVTGFASVDAGNVIGLSYSFIPGYTWTPYVDTVSTKNYFKFFSNEENGDATYPSYIKHDWNCSYIIPSDVRYNNAATWNGSFIPSFAYMGSVPDYAYEHHWIDYKLTCTSCTGTGIAENNSSANLVQVSPNPVTDNGDINISLSKNSKVEVNIFDITGRFVGTVYSGQVNAGSQKVSFDASEINSGVYFISMKVNNGTAVTSKLVVAH